MKFRWFRTSSLCSFPFLATLMLPAGAELNGRCHESDPFIGDGVVALCGDRFPEAKSFSLWVVHFYGGDCLHCQEVAHVVRQASRLSRITTTPYGKRPKHRTQVNGIESGWVHYGAVDCHRPENVGLCRSHGIWKFPAVRALGPSTTYSGPYEADALLEWVRRAVSPVSSRRLHRTTTSTSPPAASSSSKAAASQAPAPALCPAYELYDESRLASTFLHAHNVYRCMAGLPLLVWDAKVFRSARAYAMQAPLDRVLHSEAKARRSSTGAVFGENIAVGYSLEPGKVVAQWYSEVLGKGHDHRRQVGKGLSDQLMWRSTKRVGCSFGPDRRIVVCHYDPAGNERGRHTSQVAHVLPGFEGLSGELRCGGPVDELRAS
mmetsp:Transcript_30057/g.64911  ORF Transcript_30057/g.64911 Transcript_30057/m.64911 type:complete len:376 (-) Transcript_30057:927-2054(-)